MRCPECEFIFSDDFDLCPGCRSDVRAFKRRLGLEVHYPDISYEALKAKLELQHAPREKKEEVKKRRPFTLPKSLSSVAKEKAVPVEEPQITQTPQQQVLKEFLAFDSAELIGALRKKVYSSQHERLFGSIRQDAVGNLATESEGVSVAKKLPELDEIRWRFDEIRREVKGFKHDTITGASDRRIPASPHLLERVEEAVLNPSLTQHRQAVETSVVKPLVREVWLGNVIHVATILVAALLLVVLLRNLPLALPRDAALLLFLRDFVVMTFAVSWFLAFWPLLNNGKLIGGMYLVELSGTKSSLKKLFYRGLIFPPLFLLFLWPVGIFSGNALHTRLLGLRVSTVTY